uniref:Uncharacterized protein n=1 Tax=Arundo donax TaxID=35708 RepID=A0A0A8Z3K2_ARUDO
MSPSKVKASCPDCTTAPLLAPTAFVFLSTKVKSSVASV